MIKIWLLYNFVLTLLIFGTSISSARSLTNYLLPLLLLPMLYYLGKELLKKPKRKKIADPMVFASNLSDKPDSLALEGEVMPAEVSDDSRRLFLKLVGSTSLSVFFMAVLGKKTASAAFFGSVPGPGTVAIKDTSGVAIDPAEKQPTDGYTITEIDDSDSTSYYGFVHKTGAWYITKEDASGSYRYAKGASNFATNWTGRALLSYGYFDAVF